MNAESRARRGARGSVDTVAAIVNTVIGEKNFEKRNAATVGSVAVTDPHAFGVAKPAGRAGPLTTARRARSVVLGGIG